MELEQFETPRVSPWIRGCLPLLHWRRRTFRREVYLTFDDGPDSRTTPKLLSVLRDFNAKATFFCVGSAIDREPEIVQQIASEGHSLGNHTYSHVSGWSSSLVAYLGEIAACDRAFQSLGLKARWFRPPFARLGPIQGAITFLRRPIAMWDVNSLDYRSDQTEIDVSRNIIENVRSGSIVLLHDSGTESEKTLRALPVILDKLRCRGYSFHALR